jgi:hypothetical protein
VLTLSPIVVSVLGIPGGLTYYFVVDGPPEGNGAATLLVGVIALLPGVLMGTTALWIAAHN